MQDEYEKMKRDEILADYAKRAEDKKALEAQWRLNADFVAGKQFRTVLPGGAVVEDSKTYYWEERQAFNHIATILDTRMAKLAAVRPRLFVRPFSSDESDVTAASVSGKILDSAYRSCAVQEAISEATMWSELTGTAFYKIGWNRSAGMAIGKQNGAVVYEGDVKIEVCPPHEIYPDDITRSQISDCRSIIHARDMDPVDAAKKWGVAISEICSDDSAEKVTVVERFTRPTEEYPNGRYEVVAGKKLLFEGDLPYYYGDGERDLPFVRQRSIPVAGSFFGVSPIERAIPVQRAYNAVKNRKHEFMNRIASGILAVEDGSLDVDALCEEGLSPGKVIVYSAGSRAPEFMSPGSIPAEFDSEEAKLLTEFAEVSGVSELMSSSTVPGSVTSGSALELLIEQDDSRLTVSTDEIRSAVKRIGKHILGLYRRFATDTRLARFVGSGGEVELITWSASNLSSDDIEIDTKSDASDTVAHRRNTILELYSAGLLSGSDGSVDENTRNRILQAFGFASLEQVNNVGELQRKRARSENFKAGKEEIAVEIYDDHNAHIEQHIAYLLSGSAADAAREALKEHIQEHKSALKEENGK